MRQALPNGDVPYSARTSSGSWAMSKAFRLGERMGAKARSTAFCCDSTLASGWGVENRAFYGLGVGTSPADVHLVQNNVLPLRATSPVSGEPRRVALPSVAVDVPARQTLYLLASPVSDTFVGMASRTPGAVVLDDTVVHLPVVGR